MIRYKTSIRIVLLRAGQEGGGGMAAGGVARSADCIPAPLAIEIDGVAITRVAKAPLITFR